MFPVERVCVEYPSYILSAELVGEHKWHLEVKRRGGIPSDLFPSYTLNQVKRESERKDERERQRGRSCPPLEDAPVVYMMVDGI